MAEDDELLGAWVAQVGRMADAADAAPEERDFKSVALELGLTEADLARVEDAVEGHLTRGRNFTAHGRHDDAIEDLSEARALAPWRDDVCHALAEAHTARFAASGATADRSQAEALVRARLDRDPDHQPSYTLLNVLDGAPAPATLAGPPARRNDGPRAARKRMLLMAGGGVVAMVALLMIMAAMVNSTSSPVGPSEPIVIEARTPPRVVQTPPETAPPVSEAPTAELPPEGKHTLPIEVVGGERFEGIAIDPTGSTIRRGTIYSSASVELRIHNQLAGQGLEDLSAAFEMLDGAGNIVAEKTVEVLNSAYATVYPGEHSVFGRSIKATNTVVGARLRLTGVERSTVGPEPPASKPVCVRWVGDKPDHLDVEIGLRTTRWSMSALNHEITVRNASTSAIANLVLQFEHNDADGTLITESNILDKKTVAAGWMPSFEPGELRAVHHMKMLGRDVKPRYDHSCVRVLQLD